MLGFFRTREFEAEIVDYPRCADHLQSDRLASGLAGISVDYIQRSAHVFPLLIVGYVTEYEPLSLASYLGLTSV